MYNHAQKIAEFLFGKGYLSGGYAVVFLIFVLLVLAFFVWLIYFAVEKKAVRELQKISWLKLKDTLRLTSISVFTIAFTSLVLFLYDIGIDKIVNLIIQNANKF